MRFACELDEKDVSGTMLFGEELSVTINRSCRSRGQIGEERGDAKKKHLGYRTKRSLYIRNQTRGYYEIGSFGVKVAVRLLRYKKL